MRTYYDPEDDTMTPEDRCERLAELGDYMRDQMLDRLLDKDGPSPEAIDADAKCDAMDAIDLHEYSQTARALLTRCFNVMSGPEINACQIATGDYDTDEGFRAHLIDSLANQYPKEISEHINQNNQ